MAEDPVATATQPQKKPGLVTGFRDFISNYSVLPLAIGVVIGNAVNDVVKSIVDGIITPLISLFTLQSKLQTFQLDIHGTIFKLGAVLNAIITFLSVALVIYIIVRLILRKEDLLKKK